jgi:putative transposase
MKDPKYDSLSHQKYSIRYHIIFSTKYRKNILKGEMSDKIKSYMKIVEQRQDKWKIEIMEIDPEKPNHIHFLIKSCPSLAPYEIIHDLKQTSTYLAWKENHDYMAHYYWTGQHHFWTRGYFCSSIGDACTKTIWNYIKNQG